MAQCRIPTPSGFWVTTDLKAHRRRICDALEIDDSGGKVRLVVIFKYKSMVYAFLVFILTVFESFLGYGRSFC